jgi:YegS/Rv2252/BmrU family lipid kinase
MVQWRKQYGKEPIAMEHLFLINPAAGPEDCTQKISQQAEALCAQLGEPCRIRVSTRPGELTDFAREAGVAGLETRIYACGGDGTLREVVTGALGYPNLSVTCVPCGSGNDYIKHFSRPEMFRDLGNFRDVKTQAVDLISANGALAVNVCSVGFDARIGTDIDAYRRLPLLSGPRAYHASVLVNLIRGVSKPCQVALQDGTVIDGDLTMVCVCNGSWYGGSYHPVPEATPEDGLLDVLVVKKVSRLTVARVISAYQKGRFREFPQLISYFRTQSLRINTPAPEPVNLDGEILRTNDTTIQVLPGAIPFFSPRNA